MRGVLVAAIACGCGKSAPATDDASPEAPPPIDAALRCPPVHGETVALRKIADACTTSDATACIDGPLTLVASPPDDGRLFAIQQIGVIRVLEDEQLRPAPFVDLTYGNYGPVVMHAETGLLGITFHPQFATNHVVYLFYVAINRTGSGPYFDVLARYTTMPDDPYTLDPKSGVPLIQIVDPYSNHNGGMIEFGSDGYLYIGTGDGGSGGDPLRNAQNPRSLLGKILRIDVDHPGATKPYGIPADNPYADGVAGEPEIFITGVRNPWRWTFDRATGDMWIADVGEGAIEELDVLPAGQQAGANLGWSMYEGDTCYHAPCAPDGMTFPKHTRSHTTGWQAIIGGQVYRGACYPDLVGWYFFTDYNAHGLSKAKLEADGSLTVVDLPGTFPVGPTSIHADTYGELFVTDIAGEIYHLEAGP